MKQRGAFIDLQARVIFLPWVLDEATPESPNVVKAWRRRFNEPTLPVTGFGPRGPVTIHHMDVRRRMAMTMTGHKTRSVFERYNITSGNDQREAAKKLAAVTDTVIVTAIAGNQTTAETRNTTQRTFRKSFRKTADLARSAAS